MAHEKGGNQRVKRGIARCEARTTHSRRGEEGREKGKGGRRTGLEEKGGGVNKEEEHAGGEGGKEDGKGRVCAPDAARQPCAVP
jgi:hypothetical protein